VPTRTRLSRLDVAGRWAAVTVMMICVLRYSPSWPIVIVAIVACLALVAAQVDEMLSRRP
jgi:hypothetical protein